MPITHVRLIYTKPIPDVSEARFEDLEDENILFLDPVLEATTATIGDLYREILARYLRMYDIIVFRGAGPDFAHRIASDEAVRQVMSQRRGGVLVSRAHEMRDPVWEPIPDVTQPLTIPDPNNLRQAEIESILRRSGAIFESSAYHYVLPYQERHAEKFIRLADALRSVYDIDRILDWLLPEITAETLLIGDTGSMLPLMLRLREHAFVTAGIKVEIATLDKYPDARIDVAAAIRAVTNRPPLRQAQYEERQLNRLFLISVSSSGRLCGLFRKLVPDSRIVVVCRTTDDQLPCDNSLVTIKIKNRPSAACDMCATHPRIYVDPKTYELLPHLDLKREVVSYKRAREKAAFWSLVSRKEAVELHQSVPYGGGATRSTRHFSVLLDTKKLAEDDWFKDRCLSALKSLGPQNLILIPEHKNSPTVQELCAAAFPECPTHAVPPGALEERLSGPIRAAKNILIADDAIVTGETMFNFRSAIYKITQPDVNCRPVISVFVMVSRTADRIPLESLERRYRNSEGVKIAWGERIFLPEEQHCPWCKERNFLSSILELLPAEQGEVRKSVSERIVKLNEWPLKWPFFMLHDGHGLPENPKAVDSFFGTTDEPLNPYAAFAAGSCVAQTMKMELGNTARSPKATSEPRKEGRIRRLVARWKWLERCYLALRVLCGYPLTEQGVEFKYADMSMVYDAYFEPTLLSSLLRTFDGVDVRHAGIDDIFERKLRVADPVRIYPGIVTELAYAAIGGKIPSKAIRATLESWQGRDKWFRMLLAIMNAVEAK